MTKLSDQPPVREQVLACLEASCSALRALEAAAARSTERESSYPEGREHLGRAAELLRLSIREMRDALGDEACQPKNGFVLPDCPQYGDGKAETESRAAQPEAAEAG